MEKIKNTMYWNHNQYEIYEDHYEIVVWEKDVPGPFGSTYTAYVDTFYVDELLSMKEEAAFQRMTTDEPFSLAIEILMQLGKTTWKW